MDDRSGLWAWQELEQSALTRGWYPKIFFEGYGISGRGSDFLMWRKVESYKPPVPLGVPEPFITMSIP